MRRLRRAPAHDIARARIRADVARVIVSRACDRLSRPHRREVRAASREARVRDVCRAVSRRGRAAARVRARG
jgi:hypothetical protein